MTLTHYIVVRRDLPVGVLLAMVAHAAGESFYRLRPDSSEKEHLLSKQEVPGLSPGRGSTFNPAETIAVVLGSRNEGRLTKLANALHHAGVPYVGIHEVDGPFAGQLMAIGVVPGDKDRISPLVNDFHMLRDIATPAPDPSTQAE